MARQQQGSQFTRIRTQHTLLTIHPDMSDPSLPLFPSTLPVWLENFDLVPKSAYGNSQLLQLPPEVLHIIMRRLRLSDMVKLLCSSKECLLHVPLAFDHQTLPIIQQFTGHKKSDARSMSLMILGIYSKFHKTGYSGHDKRWKLMSKINSLALYIHEMRQNKLIWQSTDKFSTPAPRLRAMDCKVEFREQVVHLLDCTKQVRVYTTSIDGRQYVSGLRIKHEVAGIESASYVDVAIVGAPFDVLEHCQDELGIRSLRFGKSSWSHGDPGSLRCWEGFSRRRQASRFRVIQDVGGSGIQQTSDSD